MFEQVAIFEQITLFLDIKSLTIFKLNNLYIQFCTDNYRIAKWIIFVRKDMTMLNKDQKHFH